MNCSAQTENRNFNSHQLMRKSLINRYSPLTLLIPFALIASVACAASKDARPSPTGGVIPPERLAPTGVAAAAEVPNRPSSSTTPASQPSTGRTSSSIATGKGKDSTSKDPPITVPTVKGRTKKDSIALVKAVRAGMQSTAWPVHTAPPLPLAILPAHRIVAFYGNPLSKKMGIL